MNGKFLTICEIAPPRSTILDKITAIYSLEDESLKLTHAGNRVRVYPQTNTNMLLYRSSHTKMKTIVFLAKHETNLFIKGVSSKYFATIITSSFIAIYDFINISCIHTFIYFCMFKKTSHFILN